MVNSCSAYNCTERFKKGSGISFFSFPSDSKLRSQWVLALKRNNFQPSKFSTLCSKHFIDSDIVCNFGQVKLREGSIPSIFDFPEHLKKKTSLPRSHRKRPMKTLDDKNEPSNKKRLNLDIASTSSQNYLEEDISKGDCIAESQIQKKPRRQVPYYFGDIKYSDLKSSESKMIWNIANRSIQRIRKGNNKLRSQKCKIQSKITKLKELIIHLRNSRNISQNCYDIMQECIPKAEQELIFRQLKYSTKKEYPEQLRIFALTLNFYSTSAYNYVRRMFSNCLPHPKTLSKWYKAVNGSPGYTTESLRAIELKCKEMEKEGKKLVCNLVMDEMSIRKHIQWNGKKQVGYINYGYPMEGDSLPEAREALVFLIVALNSRWKLPIGYFLINGLGAEEKASLVKGCLRMLNQVGVEISSITFDGAATNLSMATVLGAKLYDIYNIQSYFFHPITMEPVYIILDACHMVKLVRNLLGDRGILYDNNGNSINWDYIKNIVELQEKYELHAATKIRKRHINYSQEKMKVKLAVQTFSDSVADALLYCSDDLKLEQFQGAHSTALFCRIINNIFDLMNTRNYLGRGVFKRPLSVSNMKFISDYFEYAKDYIINLTNDKREQIIISRRKVGLLGLLINMSSIEGILKDQILEKKNLNYLLTYKLSQDHLEMFFSNIRSRGGFNNNPTAVQFETAYKKILVHVELNSSESANCLAQDATSILKVSSRSEKVNIELDALNQEDEFLDDEFVYFNFDQYSSDVVAYIAGFVCKKLVKNFNCNICSSSLTNENSFSLLLERKNRGGLMKPSSDVVTICRKAETVFRSFQDYKSGNVVQRLILKTIRSISFDNIFPNLNEHIFDQDPLNNHLLQVVYNILKVYFTIRIHHKNKSTLENEEHIRQKFTKLILFKGQ